MKKNIFSFLVGLFVAMLFAFASPSYEVRKSTADVDMIQGLYVFTDSKPVSEFDFLGTIKGTDWELNPQYTNIRDNIIKRAKKKYPEGNGIILHLNSGGSDHADVILLK